MEGTRIKFLYAPMKDKKVYSINDLVSFGNYVLSEERILRIKNNPFFTNKTQTKDRVQTVHDADLANWHHALRKSYKPD